MSGLRQIDVTDDMMRAALSMFGYEPEGPRETWDREMCESEAVRIVAGAIAIERTRLFDALAAQYEGWAHGPGADDTGALALSVALFNVFPELARAKYVASPTRGSTP
jgi:hypothetical protein